MRRFTIYAAWLLLFVVAASEMVSLTTDYWWFSALGQGDTFIRMMKWRGGGFVVGALLFALIFGQNVRLALSYLHAHTMDYVLLGSGVNRFGGPSFDTIRRASMFVTYVAIFTAGMAAANKFDLWVALFSTIETAKIDQVSGRDIAFFLFKLPALIWIWNFFGITLFLSFCFCAGLYLWSELIETGPQILRVSRRVATHLAYLSALLIVWQGVWLGIKIVSAPVMLGWTRSEIFGPADANFRIPTLFFFFVTSFPLAYLVGRRAFDDFSTNLKRIPIGFVASLWLGLSFILPALSAPFGRSIAKSDNKVAQSETSNPSSNPEQRAAIARHLISVRRAWQIDHIPTRQIKSPVGKWINTTQATVSTTANHSAVTSFANEDLWPTETLRQAINKSKNYDISNGSGIARIHTVSRENGVIYRALVQNLTSKQSSEGATLIEVTTSTGAPKIVNQKTIPSLLLTETPLDVPRDNQPYVQSVRDEQVVIPPLYRISSKSDFAVNRSNLLQTALLAFRFHDSSLLSPNQNVSWYLDPAERAKELFPFLNFGDGEAIPEIVGGKLYWNVAGYSFSRDYPDSAILQTPATWRGVNYLRQSTAVVMDGATGRTTAMQLWPSEPFSAVWKNAFPQAFSELPYPSATNEALKASIKPTAAFVEANAQILARYHTEPKQDNDISDFEDTSKMWRLWNDKAQQSQNWLCTFVSARSTPDDGKLKSFFQASPTNFASNPQLNWQEYRPKEPIELPKEANPQTPSPIEPFAPKLFCLKLGLSNQPNGETRLTLLISTASKENKSDSNWTLAIESHSVGETDTNRLSPSENMIRSANLWREWKQATKEGNWLQVQKLEQQLDDIFSKF